MFGPAVSVRSSGTWWPILAPLLLGVALLTHWPVRHGFFQVDDFLWLDIAQWRSVLASFVGNQGAHLAYRPILRLSTYVDASLFGDDAAFWHLENVAMHAANGLLLAVLTRAWRMPRGLSAAAGLLFVLAPLSGESVNWISGRTSLLCLTFGLLAAWRWTAAIRTGRAPWAAIGWMVLGCMTYEAAFAIPLMLFCLVPMASRRFGVGFWRTCRLTLLPLVALAAFMLVRAAFIGTFTGSTDAVSLDIPGNVRHQFHDLWVTSRDVAGPVALTLLGAATLLCCVAPGLRPAGPCLVAAAALSLVPYAEVAVAGGRFFYVLQAPLCVLATLPTLLAPPPLRNWLLSGLILTVLPGFATSDWRDAAAFTRAGEETSWLIGAVQRAIPADNGFPNVVDGVPELSDGRIMMGDYFEIGVAHFYRPKHPPMILRTRTVLYYPQISADILSQPTRYWRYDGATRRVEPTTRDAWLSAHPNATNRHAE